MTNNSASGYCVLALKRLGYDEKEINKVLDELDMCFDMVTEYEAEQYLYSDKWKNKEVE